MASSLKARFREIEHDLRRRYGQTYRILRASSGAEASEALNKLKERNETVALIVTDQRMPQMDGVTLIQTIRAESPDARIIILTTYDGDEDICSRF